MFNFNGWDFFEPIGVQRWHVPHFKGLISAKVDLEAQGRDSTFTFCHANLKGPFYTIEGVKTVCFFHHCKIFCAASEIGRGYSYPSSQLTYQ